MMSHELWMPLQPRTSAICWFRFHSRVVPVVTSCSSLHLPSLPPSRHCSRDIPAALPKLDSARIWENTSDDPLANLRTFPGALGSSAVSLLVILIGPGSGFNIPIVVPIVPQIPPPPSSSSSRLPLVSCPHVILSSYTRWCSSSRC